MGPEVCGPDPEEGREVDHGGYCVEQESYKVRKCGVGDAVLGPRAVVVHFWYTSVG